MELDLRSQSYPRGAVLWHNQTRQVRPILGPSTSKSTCSPVSLSPSPIPYIDALEKASHGNLSREKAHTMEKGRPHLPHSFLFSESKEKRPTRPKAPAKMSC